MKRDAITLLAARAASILMQWAGLSPLRKNDNGDRTSEASGLAMMLGAMADKTGPLPDDAESKMAAHIEAKLREQTARREGSIYYTLDVDYGPGRELSELTDACGLSVSWPIKSSLGVCMYPNSEPGQVCNRQGYGASGCMYSIVPERESWLITDGFSVDRRVRAIVFDAVKAGSTVATIESL